MSARSLRRRRTTPNQGMQTDAQRRRAPLSRQSLNDPLQSRSILTFVGLFAGERQSHQEGREDDRTDEAALRVSVE